MKFKFEPQSTAEVIRLGIAMLIIFQILPWTPEQEVAVLAFASIALTWFTRSFSIPTQEIVDAGGSVANVKAVAEDNRRAKDGIPPAIPPAAMGILLAIVMLGSTGCALFRANATEPERPVASTGIAIQEGLTSARTTTTELFNAKAYPFNGADAQDKYRTVLGYFREAAVAGNTLADALAVYTAQPTDTNAQKVMAAFSTLNTKWPPITKELGGDSLPGRLVSVVAEVNKLMAQVRNAFAKPSARRQHEVFAWV